MEKLVQTLGAVLTIGIFSVLYRENRFFRLCEHLFIGVATGYGMVLAWTDNLKPQWWDAMVGLDGKGGHWWWMFAPMISLLYFTIYTRRYAWMSRVLMSTLLGAASGQVFKAFAVEVIPQVASSFKAIGPNAAPPGSPVATMITYSLDNLIFVVTLLSVMTYFFFSFEHKNPAIRSGSKVGRWMLMLGFGAMFGNTIMARFSLFIGRVSFLFFDWLGDWLGLK